MSEIGTAQDLDVNLRRKLASGCYYKRAKRLHFAGWALAVAFALASPVVLLLKPDLGPILGALAGAWVFLSRFLLEPTKQGLQLTGARAQEQFDCEVLALPWNDTLAHQLSEEEIRKASGSMKGADKAKRWYPTDQELPWPHSVLVCQRSNAVWARRQHQAFGWTLAVAAVTWALIGIAIAIAYTASLAQYLTTIALPSLPALLDASEMSRRHREAADRRQALEDQANALLASNAPDEQALREVQDQLFTLRRDEPLVPEWFYKILKADYEEDMRYAAERATESSPWSSS